MKFFDRILPICCVALLFLASCNPGALTDDAEDIRVIKGLYSYGPEIKLFNDCEEGREYWVADSAKTLELAYSKLDFEKPYYPVYIEVEGKIVKSDSSTVNANFDSTLVVTKLIKLTKEIPDGPCSQ